jgi:YjbE family integral membrane protein
MLGAFFQVFLIDLTLAGDNAVAVGLAAAGLPPPQRRSAIGIGLAAAAAMLCLFALVAVQLLKILGLLLAGGLLLLWVCWRMWRDLRAQRAEKASTSAHATPAKTLRQAVIQIFVADLSMSLDNVLAVAGAAREHPSVLVAGLGLSIALTGFAAAAIARFMHRVPWIGYVGLAIVVYVAGHMIWQGAGELRTGLGR